MPQIDDFTRGRIVGMLEAGMSIAAVARRIHCDRKTVRRWWDRYQQDGSHKRKAGSGRPRRSSAAQDRKLVLQTKRNRFTATRVLHMVWRQVCGVNVSVRTAYRRLLAANLRSRRPLLRIPLGPQHRRARINWSNEHLQWEDEWKKVLFTDESRFCMDFNDGRVRVRRQPNERFSEVCIMEHDRYGGGSVLMWGGISWTGKTLMVRINGTLTAQRYVEDVVEPVVVPYLQECPVTEIFQQDNARPHSAALTQQALQRNNVEVLPWPARSPDLSPIEHVWDIIGRRINDHEKYPLPSATLDVLEHRIRTEWDCIDQQEVRNLISSMPRRLIECTNKRGGHTCY